MGTRKAPARTHGTYGEGGNHGITGRRDDPLCIEEMRQAVLQNKLDEEGGADGGDSITITQHGGTRCGGGGLITTTYAITTTPEDGRDGIMESNG